MQRLGSQRPCGAFGELRGQATGTCLWKNDGWLVFVEDLVFNPGGCGIA